MFFKEKYGNAIYEILRVLENTKEEYKKNIPSDFIEFLKENVKSKDTNEGNMFINNKHELSKEAKDILGVIYINWLCSEEEKNNYVKRLTKLK